MKTFRKKILDHIAYFEHTCGQPPQEIDGLSFNLGHDDAMFRLCSGEVALLIGNESLGGLDEYKKEYSDLNDDAIFDLLQSKLQSWLSFPTISQIQRMFRINYTRACKIRENLKCSNCYQKDEEIMNEKQLPVITSDYPENLKSGVMICGINFGYSDKDEAIDNSSGDMRTESPSFFSDPAVNKTRFRNRILKWLNGWGIAFGSDEANLTANDKSYFQTNWLDSQTKSITSNEKIDNDLLIAQPNIEKILHLIEQRKPRAIVFVGKLLIEAFNDIRVRDQVEGLLGCRSGNATIYKGKSGGQKSFSVLSQTFGNTLIVCLPHTNSIGLTDDYMQSIELPTQLISVLRNYEW